MKQRVQEYENFLWEQEKSENTIKKYMRDLKHFLEFLGDEDLGREKVLLYKEYLQTHYKTSSANSMLIALNGFLRYLGREECCVRICRMQRQIFRPEERNLNRKEYERLVEEARKQGKERLCYILQTIACTGIRIGELSYITVESLKKREVRINFKGKIRVIILTRSLALLLMDYCRKMRIKKGRIFVTRNGRSVSRQCVWAEMKELCKAARVMESKVFPHNLRHLFARCFYEREKDLARLADYLGHSSVETTRRYTMISSMEVCAKQLELGLMITRVGEKKNDIMCIMS